MTMPTQYDVVVVGGGHAGTEAALAAARVGAKTLLISHNIETLGQMSCNPAIGGIGKGHLVKEIDALGGIMAQAADHAGIHFRTLNSRKGPAVRATRAQADRKRYKNKVRIILENQENLSLFQQEVVDIGLSGQSICSVTTKMGWIFETPTVVLTAGTFLAGKIHIGLNHYSGGRAGDPAAIPLAEKMREMGFRVERLKTGTPPRIDRRSIDFSQLDEQPGDDPRPIFSFLGSHSDHPTQISCHIAKTNEKTHDLIRGSLSRSPLYAGVIEGVGPRYCPSIEDKVVRFADKSAHQIFIEPEGLDTNEIYPNGISTSLPFDVQYALVQSMTGFEQAVITRPGYAIEYDFFDPRDLKLSLESKQIQGLYFAGQINGTTGYEEAAAQGLLAGLNAARQVQGKAPWCPRRDASYIGVMVDDLVTRGTREPYRMFTSRAEYRLMLREDNADLRLTETGRELGLVDDLRWQRFCEKREAIAQETERLRGLRLQSGQMQNLENQELAGMLSPGASALELLKRPNVTYRGLMSLSDWGPGVDNDQVGEQVEIQTKYAGYIQRQQLEIKRHRHNEQIALPLDLDYAQVRGLSAEIQEKLTVSRPETLGVASRIPGVTPAAISVLMIHLKKIGCL